MSEVITPQIYATTESQYASITEKIMIFASYIENDSSSGNVDIFRTVIN